jgi:hypothetical protein
LKSLILIEVLCKFLLRGDVEVLSKKGINFRKKCEMEKKLIKEKIHKLIERH